MADPHHWSTTQKGMFLVLEAYQDPENELTFEPAVLSHSDHISCIKAVVSDSRGPVLEVMYFLSVNNHTTQIAHIYPATSANRAVPVWSNSGREDAAGVDFGFKAVKWLFKKIKADAASRGYVVHRWMSNTRVSGAYGKTAHMFGDVSSAKTKFGRLENVRFDISDDKAEMLVEFLLDS
jgi:hypothetical protein